MILHGVLTLTSPFHTTASPKGLRLQRDGRVTSREDEGIPVVSTVTAPVTVRGQFHGDIPIIPSSAIIGRLRRMAARRLRTALTSDGKRLPTAIYYALTNGHSPGKQQGNTYTLEDYNRVRDDIFFGLFGGGSLRYAANYIQSDLYPVTHLTVDAGLVPQKFADLAPVFNQKNIEPWQLFDYRVMRKIDDIRRGRDTAVDVEPGVDGSDERYEAAVAYQAIPTGTSMYWRTTVPPGVNRGQLGLLLLALQDLMETQRLGGRTHNGWGGFISQRFRLVDGATRTDLFDQQLDDEGIAALVASEGFSALCEPTLKALTALAKDPALAREHIKALLHV